MLETMSHDQTGGQSPPPVRGSGPQALPAARRVQLAARVWLSLLVVRAQLWRRALPDAVERLGHPALRSRYGVPPARLGKIVSRSLRVGPFRPRCLLMAMVLYRLLRKQGDVAQLVIGLPREPYDKDAHAWVEVDGRDVGPPPGRGQHERLATYG